MAVTDSVFVNVAVLGMSIAVQETHKDTQCFPFLNSSTTDSHLPPFEEPRGMTDRVDRLSPRLLSRSTKRAERVASKVLSRNFAVSLSKRAVPRRSRHLDCCWRSTSGVFKVWC